MPELSSVPDTILLPETLSFAPFSIPGFSGETLAAFVNADTSNAPFLALLKMAPGARLERHFHPEIPEAILVLDGEMINDNQRLPVGSFTVHGPGVAHGPHATETGCTLLFIQSRAVGPDDSVFTDGSGM